MSIKDSIKLKVAIIGCVFIVTTGCSLFPKEEEIAKPPLAKAPQDNYVTVEAKTGPVTKKVTGTGYWRSSNAKAYAFTKSGNVAAVNVKKGQPVSKGDVLIQLNNDGLDLTVKERERDLELAKLQVSQAKESRDPQKIKVALLGQDIAMAKLEDARKQMAGRAIVAEAEGVVSNIEPLKPGDYVQENRPYVTIEDPSKIVIEYTAAAVKDIQEVQLDKPAKITYRGVPTMGKVVQIPSTAPVSTDSSQNDRYSKSLFIQPDTPPAQVVLGDVVDLDITILRKENVILIPAKGLGTFMERTYVKVLDGESVRELDVEKGIQGKNDAGQETVEIVKGLNEGQKVIVQ